MADTPVNRPLSWPLVALSFVVLASVLYLGLRFAAERAWRYQRRANYPEARQNLKALYTSERAYYQEKDTYTDRLVDIGFQPELRNRYAYYTSTAGTVEDRSRAAPKPSPTDTGIDVDLAEWGPSHRVPKSAIPHVVAGGLKLGVTAPGTDGHFACVAVGNIDDDPTLDVWSISDVDRRLPDGTAIPAGEPYNEVNDVNL